MSNNNHSDDEEMFLVGKIQAQKVEIEALQKQLRVTEFQFKQQILELTNELERERKRTGELENEINTQISSIGQGEIQSFATQLEQKLSEAENKLLEYKANELKLQKEIQSLKRKPENEEIDELKQQLVKMEETAIALIVEKEKVIQDLKSQLECSTQIQETFHDQIHHSDVDDEKDIKIQNLKQLVQELNQKIEQDQLHFDERLMKLEHEITERVLDSISHQINESKSVEQDLLHQINLYEEKIKNQDKLLVSQEKLLQQVKDEKYKEVSFYEGRNAEMQKKLSSALQQVLKSDRKSEDAFKQYTNLQREKTILQKQRDEQVKLNVKLENNIRKQIQDMDELRQYNNSSQQQIDDLEQQVNHLEQQLQETKFYYEEQLQMQKIHLPSERLPSQQEEQGQGGNLLSELLTEEISIEKPHNTQQSEDSFHQQIPQTPQSKNGGGHLFASSRISNASVNTKRRYQEMEQLKIELHSVKHENEQLAEEIENYEHLVGVLQQEIKAQLLEIQNLRKGKLDYSQERDLRIDQEQLKQSLHKLETHFITAKLSWAEEVNFLKSEVKRAEKQAQESTLLYNQILTEKEYFQSKLKKLETQIAKKEKKNQNSQNTPLSPIKEDDQTIKKKGFLSYFGK
ncbi:unnamed protein product (macronuclear) [Paramecium tetraurelia]|uniref:Uncharacterized protein n=1 Tax=Paramecium tetraurelia TaxID=5888 RepID=A0BIG0_PARTE|nr:uncharacterized protein GSPATT00004699001 [Paramecium tetraurelia]CAK58327.1 unnamed protein product [Paramecium tetraurelia]|eukprot:XP_001425725.1 hypothetical protein (macronuclear) [Paramecium tetraurelia strain d4-2]